MDRWIGKTAVVTGAASGIGEAITRALLRKGVNVIALDIQKERLKSLAECELAARRREGSFGMLRTIHCDISVKEDLDAAFEQIEAYGGVDIMVNNAGVVRYSRIIDSNREEFEKLLNVNFLAVAVCVNKAVRSMRKRNVEGYIFNINSVLGHKIFSNGLTEIEGLNGFNIYPPTKHATVCLTEMIQQEIAAVKAPIRVTSICPGLVKSNISRNWKEIQEMVDKSPYLEPDNIADPLIYALGLPPDIQISEMIIKHTKDTLS